MLAAPRPLVLAVAALVSVASCGDSTAPNGPLTAEEARELAAQMGASFVGDLSSSAASAVGGGATFNAIPAPFSFSVDLNVECPRGGTARLTLDMTGTIDEATESLTADLTGTQRPNNCGYPVHGKTISTTGSLTVNAHVEIENGLPVGTHTVSLVGEFDWRASDGRRGTCTVNYNATANYTANVATVSGNFCGSTIDFTGPLTTS
jgi:hypothetical protein